MVNLPLDGHTQEVVSQFRRGRKNLLQETLSLATLLKAVGIPLGLNTVVTKANVHHLDKIHTLASQIGADEWQLFEFDERGPNPSRFKSLLKLDSGELNTATQSLKTNTALPKITKKDLATRENTYFLINDAGIAWQPSTKEGEATFFGHVTHDRVRVLKALRHHIQNTSKA